MPVDDRLRQGLALNAAHHQSSVETHLAVVLGRGRRRARTQRAVAAAAVVSTLGLVAVLGHGLGRPGSDDRLVPAAGPLVPALTGVFVTQLPEDLVSSEGRPLGGRWTVGLEEDGTMTVSAPPSYQGVVSGALFQASPGVLRTSVFEQDLCPGQRIGSYSWTRSARELVLEVRDDTCAGRVLVLTSLPWQARP